MSGGALSGDVGLAHPRDHARDQGAFGGFVWKNEMFFFGPDGMRPLLTSHPVLTEGPAGMMDWAARTRLCPFELGDAI
jgi:hypothetical protein